MRQSLGQADLVAPASAVRALDAMPQPEIGTTFTGPLAGDGGSGDQNINNGNAPNGRTRMKKSRSVGSFGSLGAVESSRSRRGRSGSGANGTGNNNHDSKRRSGSIGARSVGSFRSLLSSLGGKSDMDNDDDDSSLSSFEGDAPPKSDSSLSSDEDSNNLELPFDHSRRRRMKSHAPSAGRTAGGGGRGMPRRRRSTGHLSSAQSHAEYAGVVATTAARRRGMKKHLSDSHVTTALDLADDDDDIDYIVQLKMMVAEAKSEADAASVHISHLTKQNRQLQQINAHLQDRVINCSSRIAELESELQRYKNQSAAVSRRRMSGNAADAAASGIGGDKTNRPAGAASAPLIDGSDLAMSDLKFRVAELERQNRNLRSKLKGSGKK